MWKILWSKRIIVVQAVLGLILVVVPMFLAGILSLIVTIPMYLIMVVVILIREARESRNARRAALIVQLTGVVSHLQKLTQGSHGASVWAILGDLLTNGDFCAQMQHSGNSQAGDLLSNLCERIFTDVEELSHRVEYLSDKSPDKELKGVINTLRQLILSYRYLVDKFLRFLDDAKGKGVPVQNLAPFAFRVHDELADDYDRLMDDARQLGIQLKNIVAIEFLEDEHLSRFRRVTLLR